MVHHFISHSNRNDDEEDEDAYFERTWKEVGEEEGKDSKENFAAYYSGGGMVLGI